MHAKKGMYMFVQLNTFIQLFTFFSFLILFSLYFYDKNFEFCPKTSFHISLVSI